MSDDEKNIKSEDLLVELVSGKKRKQKKIAEEKLQKQLVNILPKEIDIKVKNLADEIKNIQEDISVKKSNALGLSLVNILNKTVNKENTLFPTVEDKAEDFKAKFEKEVSNDSYFSTIINELILEVIDKNDKNYNIIYQLAIGAFYKYIKEDLIKILKKEKDVLEGKIQYYGADYNYIGGDTTDLSTLHELYEEIDRLNAIIVELSKRPEHCPDYRKWGDFGPQNWGSFP